MFSDHLPKSQRISNHHLFLIAAALVIVCQLVAIAMVAGGQVKRAELRESQLAAQKIALVSCFESSARFDRNNCTRYMQSENSTDASDHRIASNDSGFDASRSADSGTGFMNVSFPSH